MEKTLPYDKTSIDSIFEYAKKLEGQTFEDVLNNAISYEEIQSGAIPGASYKEKKRKGGLGNLIEECYFRYKANSSSNPDFPEAGLELKVSPYEINKSNEKRAGERLVLSMINYDGPIEDDLYSSHVWQKCKKLLLIYYLRNKELDNMHYPIKYVSLFTPSEKDLAIIENDYKIIHDKIVSGKAEELSESDTFYLGACTKGATAEKSIVLQFYSPHTPAKKRAFCYKNSYMTHVLNEYVINDKNSATFSKQENTESIIKDVSELSGKSFEDYVVSKINKYVGKTDKQLCSIFGREYNNNKAQWIDLAYRMLGIKSNKAEELIKANIKVKAIRLNKNGKMKENMSFPPFKYRELIKEEWEDSTLHNYFDETKFLFVVYKHNGEAYELKGCKMWNMPYKDLNDTVKQGWNDVVNTIKTGVVFTRKKTNNGIVIENNFPKKKDNTIIHVRPHANKRYYEFLDGTIIGDGNRSDANQLPDGTWMPHYSFWINNDYIEKQLD